MNIFEGYVGIRLWDGQLVDDVIFSLLLFLFIVFSFVFRTNFQLFVKMLKDNQKRKASLPDKLAFSNNQPLWITILETIFMRGRVDLAPTDVIKYCSIVPSLYAAFRQPASGS